MTVRLIVSLVTCLLPVLIEINLRNLFACSVRVKEERGNRINVFHDLSLSSFSVISTTGRGNFVN